MGTATDDVSTGTLAWTNLTNGIASDNSYISVSGFDYSCADDTVKIIKGGTISSNNKSLYANLTLENYRSYGSGSDLWGMALTPTDIKNANFGLAFATQDHGWYSHFLKATNFDFSSIPDGAVINGVVFDVEAVHSGAAEACRVDHIRAKVYYTN